MKNLKTCKRQIITKEEDNLPIKEMYPFIKENKYND